MPLIKSLKDKNKKKQNHQQKHQTDINRNSGQNLMDALKNVEIGMSGIENPEGRRVFRSITQTFIKYVDNTPAIGQYDVTEMDAILLGMIEIYGQALKEGDLDTAKRGVEYIQTVYWNIVKSEYAGDSKEGRRPYGTYRNDEQV